MAFTGLQESKLTQMARMYNGSSREDEENCFKIS